MGELTIQPLAERGFVRNRIPREVLQDIQDRTSLVSVVSRYVTLRRQGRRHVGLCPFHSERSPSFHVVESKGLYYCFGCQEGGDVFKFIMRMENRPFPEAVRELAEQAGVEIPEPDLSPEERRLSRQRESLLRINEEAARWFESQLDGPAGASAVEYLKERGLTSEIAHRFRVGLAPDAWQGLVDHLDDKSGAVAAAMAAGLVLEGRGERPYDRFRNRVMFPITNPFGKVIAFGGRALGDDPAKYMNSPESAIFNKSDALYGISEARRAIGQQDSVLVVEGYFDVLSLFVHGVENVVATCGTSLTRGHLRMLRRYTRNVILVYDGDAAGQRAAERSLELFLDEGMWPLYLTLPEGQDPDDVVRKEGADGFRRRMRSFGVVFDNPGVYGVLTGEDLKEKMAACKPLLDHIIIERCRDAVRTSMGTADLVAELAPLIARLRASQRGFYLNLVSEHTGIQPTLIEEQLNRVERQSTRGRRERDDTSMRTPELRLDLPREEEALIQLLLQHGDIAAPKAAEWGVLSQMTHSGLRDVADVAIAAQLEHGRVDASGLLEGVEDEALSRRLSALIVRGAELPDEEIELSLEKIFLKIRQRNLKLQLKALQEQIARLSRSAGDPKELEALVRERLALARENGEIDQRLRSNRAVGAAAGVPA